jgi:acyl-coenzyme A thioesterase PaaI-like protein
VLASKPAVAELIGFNVEEISDGHAIGFLQAGPQHANPMGTMHGGILCDLADAAMRMAFASTSPLGYIECDVADQDGKQIAKASCSCFVLRGEHAKQR